MSGTDYTTTPTLGLFKPNYDMDAEQWGSHLNQNADMLDAYLSPGGNPAFVPTIGGTMTGLLVLSGDPSAALGAASKQYVDGAVNRAGGPFLPLATGGTVSGATTFSGSPISLTVTNNASVGGTFSVGGNTTASTLLSINGAVNTQRRLDFFTAGSLRWRLGEGTGAESGGNVGSDLFANAYSDAGALIGTAFTLTRADRQLQLIKLRIGGAAAISYSGAPNYNECPLAINYNYTGTTDYSSWQYLNYIGFVTDTVDVGPTQQAIGIGVLHYFGGTGITGGRSGFRYQLSQTGACPANANYQAGLFTSDMSYSSGGTDLYSGAAGVGFGAGVYTSLNTNATNYRGIAGLEVDYGITGGATAAGLNGIQVIRWAGHNFAPPFWEGDNCIVIGSQAFALGAKFGISFGASEWPVDRTNGRLIGAIYNNQWWTARPMQAAHGVDFFNVDLTGTALRARGFSVLGSGATLPAGTVQVGRAYLSSDDTSAKLDVVGSRCTAAAIATGGANLIAGTALIHDATGTYAAVTTVSGGVATAITLMAGGFAITPPTNPVTFRVATYSALLHPGAPTAPTLNLTWTQANALSIQPSGGATTFGGPVTLPVDTLPTFSMSASGAKGDGVTDDQPVIQAWLNSLETAYTAAEVVLPPNKWYYIHAAPLTVPNGFVIRGAYNTKDNQSAGGGLFASGGFYIDPALPAGIIMLAAATLRNLKVYRFGMTASASNAQATTDYGIWAAEGVYKKTSGAIANGATTIPLSDTSGITAGMPVTGLSGLVSGVAAGWVPITVTAITPGVSVTISSGMVGAQGAGIYLRFGASIGVMLGRNCSGNIIEDCVIIGFRTGIQAVTAQYSIFRCTGDCITNIELSGGADYAVIRDCEWLPLYGMYTNTGFCRAGDMVFVHDCAGPSFHNSFGIGWQIGWHFENSNNACYGCSNETPPGAGAGTENWVVRGGSSMGLYHCHAQAGGTGFHIDGSTQYYFSSCTSSGSQTPTTNNVAHFLIENTIGAGNMYGSIITPQMLGGYPSKLPVKFGSGTLSTCNLVAPSMQDMSGVPSAPFVSGPLPLTTSPTFVQGMAYLGNRTNGGSSTIQYSWNGLVFDSTLNPVTSHTLILPAYPMDGQTTEVHFNVAVTALTWSTTDGTLIGNYGSPTAGQRVRAIYSLARNTWFIGGVSTSSFLPLTGGTVTGATTFSSTLAVTGSAALSNGITFGAQVGASNTDLSKHIQLYGPGSTFGLSVTSNRLNYVASGASAAHVFMSGAGTPADILTVAPSGTTVGGTLTVSGTSSHVGNATFGATGTNNVLTIAPGAASSNAIAINQSGTGGINFGANIIAIGSSIQAQTVLTSGTIGGTSAGLTIQTAAGNNRNITFTSASTARWSIRCNSTAEGGSQAGSDLDILPANDVGTMLITPAIRITRANSNVALSASLGVFGATPPAKPTVSGAKGSNAALASLIAALVSYGLVNDTTTA